MFSTCKKSANSSFIYLSTQDEVSRGKRGDFIQFQNDPIIHQIYSSEKISHCFPFSVQNGLIKCPEIVEYLIKGDILKIIYKVYEIDCFVIKNGGNKFTLNSKIGLCQIPIDCSENGSPAPSFTVSEIGPKGEIKALSLLSRGIILSNEQKIYSIPNPNGLDGEIELILREKETRTSNVVVDCVQGEYIQCQYPPRYKGNLYLEKYKVKLNTEFKNNEECNYVFLSQVTENLKMPLLLKHNFESESIINRNFITLDAKIIELERKMNDLLTGRT